MPLNDRGISDYVFESCKNSYDNFIARIATTLKFSTDTKWEKVYGIFSQLGMKWDDFAHF